jgi:hypothetical protein
MFLVPTLCPECHFSSNFEANYRWRIYLLKWVFRGEKLIFFLCHASKLASFVIQNSSSPSDMKIASYVQLYNDGYGIALESFFIVFPVFARESSAEKTIIKPFSNVHNKFLAIVFMVFISE